MKVFATLLLAVASQAAPAANVVLPYAGFGYGYSGLGHGYAGLGLGYAGHHYAAAPAVTYATAVHSGNAVPLAVGGYKAEAGCNGDLCGPVHHVPAQFGALAAEVQESSGAVKLTTGTGHLVTVPYLTHHALGKREAVEAVETVAPVAPIVYGGFPHAYNGFAGAFPQVYNGFAGVYPYAVPQVATHTYKTYTPTVETNLVATGASVPVAVGGYKAVAGDNGDLKGAVHEVPAIFGAPALNVQTNEASQGSLSVGTSAVVTYSAGEPIVNEHSVQVPVVGYGYPAYNQGYGFGHAGYVY